MRLRFAGELAESLCARFLIADIVAQRQRLVEAGKDCLQRRQQAVGAHLSSTWRTLSGWERALASKLPWPNSTNMRSVPTEMRLRRVAMSNWPGAQVGTGVSSSSVAPVLRFWMICFMA